MAFLETDVQGSDHICHDLMDDLTAIEDQSADEREFIGNAHSVVITAEGVTIECTVLDEDDTSDNNPTNTDSQASDNKANNNLPSAQAENTDTVYRTGLKHFREVLEDWEAFILDDQSLA